jgi:hypothetical protein
VSGDWLTTLGDAQNAGFDRPTPDWRLGAGGTIHSQAERRQEKRREYQGEGGSPCVVATAALCAACSALTSTTAPTNETTAPRDSSSNSDVQPTLYIPSLIGLTQKAAGHVLRAAGLNLGIVITAVSPQYPAGVVVASTPSTGTGLRRGSSVNIAVSVGSPPQTRTTSNATGLSP